METEAVPKKKKLNSVPNLRFKDYESIWERDKLENLTSILRCGIAATPTYVNKGIPFLSAQNVTKDGTISLEKYSEISEEYYYELSRKHKLLFGDLLYSRVGAGFGTAAIFPFNGEFGVYVSLTHIRVNNRLINEYLKFYLNSSLGKAQAFRGVFQGGGVPNLNVKVVEKFRITFPSIAEQRKIASFLSAVDKKIQQLTRKKELLETYKKGVMQQLFLQEIKFKDEDGKDFPEWEKISLDEIGKIITGSTPPTSDSSYYNGDRLFVSPSDIAGGRYVNNTKTKISEKGLKKGRLIKSGSVLFVCIGSTIGKVAQAGEDCITNQQINSIVPSKGYCADFIYSLLNFYGDRVKLLAGVQAVPQINKTDFSKLKFTIPVLKEQQKIADFLSAIDKKIEAVSQQMEKTQQFKKGLLQQMFV